MVSVGYITAILTLMMNYFNFDGYGNLQSFSEYEHNEMINDEKEEIIETALELYEQGNIDIQWLIDEYVQE